MSDTPSPSHQKSRSAVALTSLLVVFAIAVLINILIGAFGWRFDLTEYKTYTSLREPRTSSRNWKRRSRFATT